MSAGRRFLIPLTIILILVVVASIGTTSGSFVDVESSTGNLIRIGAVNIWYDPAWGYRRPITINNPGDVDLIDYQVKVTMDTQELIVNGKMQSNCEDIRFTQSDGVTEIYYWIESGIGTDATDIWVKVPYIPTGESTIYIYYGNNAASPASSAEDTFSTGGSFIDNFRDSSKIDTSDSENVVLNGNNGVILANTALNAAAIPGANGSGILCSVAIPEDDNTRLAVGGIQLSWDHTKGVKTDIKYQLEYYYYDTDEGWVWGLIPDEDLRGNEDGFYETQIDISRVTTKYGQLRLMATLISYDGTSTPTLKRWKVTYYYREYASQEPTISGWGAEEPYQG